MNEDRISQLLTIIFAILIFILFILCIMYIVLKIKEKSVNTPKTKKENGKNNEKINSKKEKTTSYAYNKQSILDFMEFDKIQDNMIVQKSGKKYLMIVECEGVNYDLMSKMEKVSVEEGFQQFLNTLRHPIQIYIQTRTMNLEKSIDTYNNKVKAVEDRYKKIYREHKMMQQSDSYDEKDIERHYFELTKAKNLLEYGKDIITNTERMSLNKNVLTKRYYVVVPYYLEEDGEKYTNDEIANIAFSELYTKAQSIISTLSACSVVGKILNSNELVELLYMAYNRDEADIFGFERALKAEYDSLYSTAPDVFEKKIKVLDEEIQSKAIDLANLKIEEAKSKMQKKAEEKEDSMDELISKMAKIILSDNKTYVGEGIAEKAIESIEKEGGKAGEEKQKKTRRTNKQ